MAFRNNYWTCGRFADWLRGTNKPASGSSEQWRVWKTTARRSHPIRFWLADTGLKYLQDLVEWPFACIYSAKCWMRNCVIDHTHALTAHPSHLRRGQWHDVGNRFLPCLFDELVNFVEVETAWSEISWSEVSRKKYKAPFWSRGFWNIGTWRCPEAGLANLQWASNLVYDESCGFKPGSKYYGKLTPQAENAREILFLYDWYKNNYLLREDAYTLSDWSNVCDKIAEQNNGEMVFGEPNTPELAQQYRSAYQTLKEIEEQRTNEDTEMLCRLIRVRDSLWT